MLHESGHIKLSDFDLSKGSTNLSTAQVVREMFGGDIKKVSSVPDLVTNSFVGTAEYIAPEVITGYGHSSAVDWWTLGILIYEMLCGRAPFQGKNRDEIFKKIMDEKVRFPEGINVSKEAKKLVRALLNPDAKKRLGAEHGAADIKAHEFFKVRGSFAFLFISIIHAAVVLFHSTGHQLGTCSGHEAAYNPAPARY